MSTLFYVNISCMLYCIIATLFRKYFKVEVELRYACAFMKLKKSIPPKKKKKKRSAKARLNQEEMSILSTLKNAIASLRAMRVSHTLTPRKTEARKDWAMLDALLLQPRRQWNKSEYPSAKILISKVNLFMFLLHIRNITLEIVWERAAPYASSVCSSVSAICSGRGASD